MKPRRGCAALLCLLLLSGPLLAGPVEARLESLLAPPQKVLEAADELGLDDAAREALRADINRTQAEVLRLQSEGLLALESVAESIAAASPEAATVLQRFDELTRIEAQIKRTHLGLWLRANALLSAEQRRALVAR